MSIKVGDLVVVSDINHGAKEYPVTKVGRKYLTAGGWEFEIETGRWNNKDFGGHKTIYTPTQWARKKSETALVKATQRFESALMRRAAIASLGDTEIEAAISQLEAWSETLEKAR